ncbi:MAG: glycoside hydrolase family 38 C-terminal domain-containing protein [Propionicimonas sp.]
MTSTNQQMIDRRAARLLEERLLPAVHRRRAAVAIAGWEVPDEPVGFQFAREQSFQPMALGQWWGRPWGTTWLHLTGELPTDWVAADGEPELRIDLGFRPMRPGFQAEGLVYRADGELIKAIEPLNTHVRLDLAPGDPIDLYVEAASNPDLADTMYTFIPTRLGRKQTAGHDPLYQLRTLEIAGRDRQVWELIQDVRTVRGLARVVPADSSRSAALHRALDAAVDAIDPADVTGSATAARAELAGVLNQPATASAHRVVAVGHAHIDSAWLWPVRETVRKCARTFTNVLDLMDEDPEFSFACSSAQQFAWIQRHYPALFQRILARVREGRFVPVGGMWVESDTNLPGGEALARQFVLGGDYFERELGVTAREVWLPDSFGYSAALPQLARLAGAEYFLTQKLSWNETNKMPHHLFEWEGIDGSTLITHFTPADNYNCELTPEELAYLAGNYADSARHDRSLVLFGYGDGGGGPTREMLAAGHRAADLEGVARVEFGTPLGYFDAIPAGPGELPRWTGELYLEFHRGTYTSQARTKRGNRRCEALLHDAELWAATAAVRTGAPYPYQLLREAWETVLLQQFHDILPGSSIGWVHDQAVANYAVVERSLNATIEASLASLSDPAGAELVFNSSPFPIAGVPGYGAGVPVGQPTTLPELTPTPEPVAGSPVVTVLESPEGWTIDNGRLLLRLDRDGLIASLRDATGREVIPAGQRAGLLQLFRDTPAQWDAWDIDVDYRKHATDLTGVEELALVTATPERVEIAVRRAFAASRVTQTYLVEAGRPVVDLVTEVDWHERQTMLKLAVPIDVHTTSAASEIQFGHLVRPTHTNTSWDTARFETVAHRWVHLADRWFGVGLANDASYGHDITRHPREGGGTYSLVRQSLLRAPLFPDPEADQGSHRFRSSIVIGPVEAAIEQGYRLDRPLRPARGRGLAPLVTSSDPAVVIETVKLAEDRSGDLVVRLYESLGGVATATLTVDFGHAGVVETDLRERPLGDGLAPSGAREASLEFRPFQVRTLRWSRTG